MHEEVLNFLMANTCHNESTDTPGISRFTFDGHCVEVIVTAKRIRDNAKSGPLKYEVLGFSWKEI